MKAFETIPAGELSHKLVAQQIAELERFLADRAGLSETGEVLPFFRRRPRLCASACYHVFGLNPDKIAFEYDLFGDFASDLVVGDSKARRYCLIEFESARPGDIFIQSGKKATLEWSVRFSRGFFQLLDWFYKLKDMAGSEEFRSRFGAHPAFHGLLVIGRNHGLSKKDRNRLEWLSNALRIDGYQIRIMTFDDLLAEIKERHEEHVVLARATSEQPEEIQVRRSGSRASARRRSS